MPVRLGERLTAQGLISNDQLRIALLEQQRLPQPLGQHLIRLGFVQESTLRTHLAQQLGYTPVQWETHQPDPDLLKLLKASQAKRHRMLPWRRENDLQTITVVTPYPDNPLAIHHLQSQLPSGIAIKTLFACEDEVDRAIAKFYPTNADALPFFRPEDTQTPLLTPHESSSIESINQIIHDAIRQRATDIHFEPGAHSLTIRFRTDGMLHTARELHPETWRSLLIRLKILSSMDIAEQRLPQDGRFTHEHHGEAVDIRSASFPTPDGEHMVLRLLLRQRALMPLSQLGLSEAQIHCLRQILQRPDGLILVTGPTGSGKTTTLYAMLQALQHESLSLITLEDPIEYRLPGIRQCAVNEEIGLTFATGIKSLLRQDPDIILIGEIRDAETARMAFQAALTGHRVLSTLHTRSALDALSRLKEFGLSARELAPHLSGLIGQRLVRKRCAHSAELEHNCQNCSGSGYFGQQILMEAVLITPTLIEAMEQETPLGKLRKLAASEGFESLAQAAKNLIQRGLSDQAEIHRVLGGYSA